METVCSAEVADGCNGAGAKRILVLDDECCILEMLNDLLKMLGYAVQTSRSPADALGLIQTSKFDLILSDVHMPQMSGSEFYKEATTLQPELKERVIFLTGDAHAHDTQTFLKTIGADYLAKPFAITKVMETIQRALERNAA